MTFMAKGLMLSLLLLGVSACGLAQSCISLEVQPFDYTLDVHGTRYAGTAVVSPVPGEPVYELTAEGYTGVREDAERIYALLDHAGEAMEEKHINREYTHSYIIGTKHVHFSPAWALRSGSRRQLPTGTSLRCKVSTTGYSSTKNPIRLRKRTRYWKFKCPRI